MQKNARESLIKLKEIAHKVLKFKNKTNHAQFFDKIRLISFFKIQRDMECLTLTR